jgi:hypothetical protein
MKLLLPPGLKLSTRIEHFGSASYQVTFDADYQGRCAQSKMTLHTFIRMNTAEFQGYIDRIYERVTE